MSISNNVKRISRKSALITALITLPLSACFHPPYNDFKKSQPNLKPTGYGTALGAVVGATLGIPVIGPVVGGTTAAAMSSYQTSRRAVIDNLIKEDIQFIQYGDTMTLIVPTDHYYLFNSAQLNDICYAGLNDIIRLLRFYPKSHIYVAGFTDNVGTRSHKNILSQAQAETMVGFLWANHISAECLTAQGYGDHFSIGDNTLIHGSAYNRRIEIQWSAKPLNSKQGPLMQGPMK